MRTETRILLVDDHQMMRAGLRSLLDGEGGLRVVGEAENGRAAVELAHSLAPHVVLMDITMPDLNGIEATRQIVAASPQTKVVALSMHADRQFVTDMLKAGAVGYLLKNSAASELLAAIRAVMTGRNYLSPTITAVVVDRLVRGGGEDGDPSAFAALTPRERQVLQLIAEGRTNKEIAAQLNVGTKTVETHRAQLMDKLNIRTVAELTKYAIRHGLTALEH
jgi:DNA-binding NarL/FixJ family response regulator